MNMYCEWSPDSDDTGDWYTLCENVFEGHHKSPEEREFKYCPFCGRRLLQTEGVQ